MSRPSSNDDISAIATERESTSDRGNLPSPEPGIPTYQSAGANMCDIEREQLTYDQMEEGVLADFNISSEQQLMGVLGRLQDAFQTTIGSAAE